MASVLKVSWPWVAKFAPSIRRGDLVTDGNFLYDVFVRFSQLFLFRLIKLCDSLFTDHQNELILPILLEVIGGQVQSSQKICHLLNYQAVFVNIGQLMHDACQDAGTSNVLFLILKLESICIDDSTKRKKKMDTI